MAAALRSDEPIDLHLSGDINPHLRVDEIVPLCRVVTTTNPAMRRTIQYAMAPAAQPGPPLSVTVIIPCSRGLPQGIDSLLNQDVNVRILVLSNGDGPRNVPGAEVIRVPWHGHGETRQAAVAMVEDPYVLFTVDDAIPLGEGFLRTLVNALEEGWEAVFARQIPWPDADRVTRARLRRWTPAGSNTVAFPQVDHVAALYHTETLRKNPLPSVPIAEDAWWSRGRSIGYVPMAPVLHSHQRRPKELFLRNRAIHAERIKMGERPTVGSLSNMFGALPGLARPILQEGGAELVNQIAELAGQWSAIRKARQSRGRD